MTCGLRLTRAVAVKYGKRGGIARSISHNRWPIEGENLTAAEIAARIGGSVDGAQKRMLKLRNMGIPLTWESMRKGRKSCTQA